MSMAQHHGQGVGSPFAFPSVSSAAAAAAATPPPAAAALYFVHGVTPSSLGGTPTWVPVEPIVMPRSPEELDAAALAHAGIASSTPAEAAVATARAAAKAEAAKAAAAAAAAAAAKPGDQAKKASPPGPASATPCSRCTAPLTEERQHQPNLVCDGGCGRTFRPGQLRLACHSCDFDLCARCSRSGQSKKRPRDAEAAAAAVSAVSAVSAALGSSTPAGGELAAAAEGKAGQAARSSAAPGSATATQKLLKSRGRTVLPA